MTKICFTPLLTRPQGCQGCQKIRTTKLKSTLVSWSAKIQPKLKKLWKTIKIEQKLSKKPYFLKVFQILFNLGWILALQLPKVVFSLVLQIFWHPWHPRGRVNSGDIIVLRFVSDIFLLQRHLAIFFILYKLKSDIMCIDLTFKKVTISLFRATMAEVIKWYKLWV
jgi:hypothetical protein